MVPVNIAAFIHVKIHENENTTDALKNKQKLGILTIAGNFNVFLTSL
jgi:hypothetical protein